MAALTQQKQAFLGVERSVSGKIWQSRPVDERLCATLMQRHDLTEAVARAIAARGITLEQAQDYLNPSLRAQLPDPLILRDMDKASAALAQAITNKSAIAVFADYDVDGATSAALLLRFLQSFDLSPRLYIPDRNREGYGPNIAALSLLHAEGQQLVLMLDCGTTAHAPLQHAADLGLPVIVIDHHAAEPALPPTLALVNPNRLDESQNAYQQVGHCAAVGVTYLLLIATNRVLRKNGFYNTHPEPDLLRLLDLVALGTVADVVKLTGINRAFVAQGLKILAQRHNQGLAALMDVSKLKDAPDAFALGYMLGPRVNAGGRVGEADLGAKLLASNDDGQSLQWAQKLNEYNVQRQAIEQQVQEQAMQFAPAANDVLVMAAGEGWHAGVIGIVAARLKEKFNRPTFVVSFTDDIGKASGRSVAGVDLGAAVIAARQAGLLVAGGGHAMAAGFTVEREKFAALKVFLNERLAKQIEAQPITASLNLDGVLSVAAANIKLVEQLQQCAPFGSGNSEPRFALTDMRIVNSAIVGEQHVRAVFTSASGQGRLAGIAFKSLETPLGQALLNHQNKLMHVAGLLRPNRWQGQTQVQLIIDDLYFTP